MIAILPLSLVGCGKTKTSIAGTYEYYITQHYNKDGTPTYSDDREANEENRSKFVLTNDKKGFYYPTSNTKHKITWELNGNKLCIKYYENGELTEIEDNWVFEEGKIAFVKRSDRASEYYDAIYKKIK